MSAAEPLQRTEELLERLRGRLAQLEQLSASGDVDGAVDELQAIAELAKEIEAEVVRARARADAPA